MLVRFPIHPRSRERALRLRLVSALAHAALKRGQLRVELLILLEVLEARLERAAVELVQRVRAGQTIVDAVLELAQLIHRRQVAKTRDRALDRLLRLGPVLLGDEQL